MYKTSKYEYSTSSSGGPGNGYNSIDRSSANNYSEINKLDTLLNDLEHERTATLDRSELSFFARKNFLIESLRSSLGFYE